MKILIKIEHKDLPKLVKLIDEVRGVKEYEGITKSVDNANREFNKLK